jgi:hypothetical protein
MIQSTGTDADAGWSQATARTRALAARITSRPAAPFLMPRTVLRLSFLNTEGEKILARH